jgi:hypothetical protein
LKSAIPIIYPFDIPFFIAAKTLNTLLSLVDLFYGTFVNIRYPARRKRGGGEGNVLIIVAFDLPTKRAIFCY